MNHFTNRDGYNSIRSQIDWLFRAGKPPGGHPFGAYFTTLGLTTPNLAVRLRIPREKLAYFFSFVDRTGDLVPLEGGRGQFVFYSRTDYTVENPRQLESGATGL